MKIAVLLLEGPYQREASDTAYNFVKAAIAKGHEVIGVFMYSDGVYNINKHIRPTAERNIAQRWDEIGAQGIPIVACSACSSFRGINKQIIVANGQLKGLGTLARLVEECDRFITFGD